MAGTKAQQYINSLYQALQTAINNYQAENSILSNNQSLLTQITTKHTNAKALYTRLQQNLTDAHAAESDVQKVMQFFAKQQSSVLTMVNNAKDMSTNAFESLYFLVQQGVGRVEAVDTIVTNDNKKFEANKADKPPNTPVPWVSSITDSIGKAQASGSAAVDSGKAAVIAAFNAYISNQTIYYRTTSYLNSFIEFQKQLKSLQTRLIQETSLAKYQSDLLHAQLKALNERVKALQNNVHSKKIAMDEAQKMYDAAQQGASYAGTSAAAS